MPLQKVKPQLNLKFAQKRANADYIQHLYDLFQYFVGTPPRVQNKRSDYQSLRFQTYSHSELKFYDQLFYLDYKYKGYRRRAKPGFPENISDLLTARALAYWFMDDGASTSKKSISRTYRFSTHSLTLEDQPSYQVIKTCTSFKGSVLN